MPSHRKPYDPAVGPIVPVLVVPAGAAAGAIDDGSAHRTPVQGLLDTGADRTCITPAVVGAFSLEPSGKRTIRIAGHDEVVHRDTYIADVVLVLGPYLILFSGLLIAQWDGHRGKPFDVLIGRDILCKGLFQMEPSGYFTLHFKKQYAAAHVFRRRTRHP